ncbi:protein FAM133-like isoform X2 [Halyomorpha halys]|uniref:protein FAM133-like isoform X2 n=2 Tax=Halyomorpha halys TaxID=286706 RepID=UPI0034D218DE
MQTKREKSKICLNKVVNSKCLNLKRNITIRRLNRLRRDPFKKGKPHLKHKATQIRVTTWDISSPTEDLPNEREQEERNKWRFKFVTNDSEQEQIHINETNETKHLKKEGRKRFSEKVKMKLKEKIEKKPTHYRKSINNVKKKLSNYVKQKTHRKRNTKSPKNAKSKSTQKKYNKRESSIDIKPERLERNMSQEKSEIKIRPFFSKQQEKSSNNVKLNYLERIKKIFSFNHQKERNKGKKLKKERSKSTKHLHSEKKKTLPKSKSKMKPLEKFQNLFFMQHGKESKENNKKKHVELKSAEKIKAKKEKTKSFKDSRVVQYFTTKNVCKPVFIQTCKRNK